MVEILIAHLMFAVIKLNLNSVLFRALDSFKLRPLAKIEGVTPW